MRRLPCRLLLLCLALLPSAPAMTAANPDDDEAGVAKATGVEQDGDAEEDALTLERLFPEKGLFGPSARSTGFSHDGRYAAYLYRPYPERRHGNDLYLFDFETGETTRITRVSVMSQFQKATRDVEKDRVEKAKKRKGKSASSAKPGVKAEDDGVSGDWEGRVTGDEDSNLPPEGLSFTLAIRLGEDGAVSGTFASSLHHATLDRGRYDPESGSLGGRLVDTETGLVGTLAATIEDGEMSGTITIAELGITVTLTARRAAGSSEDAGGEGEGDESVDRNRDRDDGDGGDDGGHGQRQDEDEELGDTVGEDDAEDEKAPRYGGVSSYVWAPQADELIFTSGGDLYRYDVAPGAITRLTRTAAGERDVQYLPDGSGFSYMDGSALTRVVFGSHLIEQLDPSLADGERMSGYRISPDGRRLVILASKGESYWGKGREVNIVNYRQRFASVRKVTRHMPDDPLPDYQWSVYLYELDDYLSEKREPKKIYTHAQSGPRDTMRVPEWSPDSSRVAFAVFEQESGHVEILESAFRMKPEDEDAEEAKTEANGDAGAAGADEDGGEDDQDGEAEDDAGGGASDEAEPEAADAFIIDDARVIYRFLHNGGPNTPRMVQPQYLADSRRLVFVTELSGFRHLHVLDPMYEQLDQLTHGRFEVYPIELSTDHRFVFATSTKDDPAQLHVYRVDLETGELFRLSRTEGYWSAVAVSDDGTRVLANHVDFGSLNDLVAFDVASDETKTLTDSHPEEAKKLTEPVPEYFVYRNRHGQDIHGHMFKPDGWTAEDHRPLLMYVYGGPLGTRKMVTRGSFAAPSYFFAYYMAKKHGYVTCTIDPRGASGYGGLFEKSNYEQVGKPQVEDLVDGARWFIEHQGVDADRIGLHGWSFGGFQTQMCLYTEPDVFACGIAGAGPTEWENYNSWYSTGTIGPNRDGKTDLEQFSLLPLAKNLKAKLLLVHGMEDSNVLYQDTVRVYRELLKSGKETLVELFLDPTGGHGLGGDVKTLNRYRKYEEFLVRVLGEETPEP